MFTENPESISIGKRKMIYLQNTREAQEVYVPRSNGANPLGDLVFKAKNTINLVEEIDLFVSDLQLSDLYFYLAVILPENVTDGEYEYDDGAMLIVSAGAGGWRFPFRTEAHCSFEVVDLLPAGS